QLELIAELGERRLGQLGERRLVLVPLRRAERARQIDESHALSPSRQRAGSIGTPNCAVNRARTCRHRTAVTARTRGVFMRLQPRTGLAGVLLATALAADDALCRANTGSSSPDADAKTAN